MVSGEASNALVALFGLLKRRYGAENVELWVEQDRSTIYYSLYDDTAVAHVVLNQPKFKGNFKCETLVRVGAEEILARIIRAIDMPLKDPNHTLVTTSRDVNDSFSDWVQRVLNLSVRTNTQDYHQHQVHATEDKDPVG